MGAALFEDAPAASGGPTFRTRARSGIESLQRKLVAAMEHEHKIDETIEARGPGGDAPLRVGGCVRDKEGGGEMQTAAQDVLVYGRGVGCARLAGEYLGHECSKVGGRRLFNGEMRWAVRAWRKPTGGMGGKGSSADMVMVVRG